MDQASNFANLCLEEEDLIKQINFAELHYAETAVDSLEGILVELRNKKERVWKAFRKQKDFRGQATVQRKKNSSEGSPKLCPKSDHVLEGTTSISLPGASAQVASTTGFLADASERVTLVNLTDALELVASDISATEEPTLNETYMDFEDANTSAMSMDS